MYEIIVFDWFDPGILFLVHFNYNNRVSGKFNIIMYSNQANFGQLNRHIQTMPHNKALFITEDQTIKKKWLTVILGF